MSDKASATHWVVEMLDGSEWVEIDSSCAPADLAENLSRGEFFTTSWSQESAEGLAYWCAQGMPHRKFRVAEWTITIEREVL